MAAYPSFGAALRFWLRLGFISFGGPAGQIAIMHTYLVTQQKWISESRFMHALNYCMLLPGPEAQQLATYTGWLLHGVRGGLAAGILFILPSLFMLLGLSVVYVQYGNIPWVAAIFDGLKPAVVAIIALALVKIGKKSLQGPVHYAMATAAFVAIFFFKIPFPLIILAAIAAGLLYWYLLPAAGTQGHTAVQPAGDEAEYLINAEGTIRTGKRYGGRLALLTVLFAMLWLAPWLVAGQSAQAGFWHLLIGFFSKAALVTFGGAYAVLPYVAQVSVQKFQWLSSLEMMDGLALGETTPGPLIMVLAFVGFMAGYHQFSGSLVMGAAALLLTVFYTFLPCFYFIFAGAPLIERTRNHAGIKKVLHMVTAAVVGVVLNLAVYLLLQVVFRGGLQWQQVHGGHIAWIVISFFALYRFKVPMIGWLGISGLYGLVYHLLSL